MADTMLNATAAAKALGVARSTLYEICKIDSSFPRPILLPTGGRRFKRSEIEAWIESRRAPTAA